jgi:hypothetical protein
MASIVYYGTIKCSGVTGSQKLCRNKAYWLSNSLYLCGVHSKADQERTELPKNPNAKADRAKVMTERQKLVEEVAKKNRAKGIKGDLICVKIGMMKEVEHHDGYLKVFPNFKHQNREDGYGCMSLSPKAMGPIDHGQPGLPIAKNLENMWQGSKCFPHETGKDGNPNKEFYTTRLTMYNDPEPHRHKKFLDGSHAKGNIPNYTVWNNHHYQYGEARQIYCHFYEKIALKLNDFLKLKQWLEQGYNLQICGYDGYHVTKSLDEHYKDTTRPFGHEMVLYTLLTLDKKDYPWRKYQTIIF